MHLVIDYMTKIRHSPEGYVGIRRDWKKFVGNGGEKKVDAYHFASTFSFYHCGGK